MLTMKARDVPKDGPHFGWLGWKCIFGEVATQSGHSKDCKIRSMVEMVIDEIS